jgi:conjugative relaxase-like TrwC/TraI family protein
MMSKPIPLRGTSISDVHAAASYPDEVRDADDRPAHELTHAEQAAAYYGEDEKVAQQPAPSHWIGKGAESLNLEGETDLETRMKLMQGFDPNTEKKLAQNAGAERVYAHDVTFSAPKSVSLLYASADEKTRDMIDREWRGSIDDTAQKIEDAMITRRGHGGTIAESARAVMSLHGHNASRPVTDDQGNTMIAPHKHDHLIVYNVAERQDGSWGTTNMKPIFVRQKEFSAYQASNFIERMRHHGYEFERDKNSFRLAGSDREIERQFSPRHTQIEERLRRDDYSGAKAAQIASEQTRQAKDPIDTESLIKGWKRDINSAGFDAEKMRHEHVDTKKFDRKEALKNLTLDRSVFKETELWAEAYRQTTSTMTGPAGAEAEVRKMKQSGDLVEVVRVPRDENGHRDESKPVEHAYTTREMLQIEREMIKKSADMAERRNHQVDQETIDSAARAIEKKVGFELSADQRQAAEYLLKGGDAVMLDGNAGAGKTETMRTAAEAWRQAGYNVVGTSPQSKGAKELSKVGVDTENLAKRFKEWEKEPPKARDVILVDEAGMVGSRSMYRLAHLAEEHGAKLVMVGQAQQLQPVEAGGAFAAIKNEIGAGELNEIRRQKNQADLDAVYKFAAGNVRGGLDGMYQRDQVHLIDSKSEQTFYAVETWSARHDPKNPSEAMMLADNNNQVRDLNAGARAYLQEQGHLSKDEQTFTVSDPRDGAKRDIEITKGERILFRAPDKRGIGVANGDRATVDSIDVGRDGRREITATLDDGGKVRFSPDMENERTGKNDAKHYSVVQHGYAGTVHTSQGATVNNIIYVPSSESSAELTYVALSRARETMDVVISKEGLREAQRELEPTESMREYAQGIAKAKDIALPEGYADDFATCREFLNDNSPQKIANPEQEVWGDWQKEADSTIEAMARQKQKETTHDYNVSGVVRNADHRAGTGGPDERHQSQEESDGPTPPTVKMSQYAERIAEAKGVELPENYAADRAACREFLDAHAYKFKDAANEAAGQADKQPKAGEQAAEYQPAQGERTPEGEPATDKQAERYDQAEHAGPAEPVQRQADSERENPAQPEAGVQSAADRCEPPEPDRRQRSPDSEQAEAGPVDIQPESVEQSEQETAEASENARNDEQGDEQSAEAGSEIIEKPTEENSFVVVEPARESLQNDWQPEVSGELSRIVVEPVGEEQREASDPYDISSMEYEQIPSYEQEQEYEHS